jgi:Xaa-Pro aminopeptidase
MRAHLQAHDLDAALICESRYVHYFTGHWTKVHQFSSVLITPEATILSTGKPAETAFVDDARTYVANKTSTLVDDRRHAVLAPLLDSLKGRIGCDGGTPWDAVENRTDLSETLRTMRRTKDADEVALIRRAVEGTEAAYARAREILAPGVSEMHVYAEMLKTATETIGEPLGEFTQDFRAGAAGGAPRVRAVEDGELMPLDVSVWLRGYSCDLCRTFAVGTPTSAQQEAQRQIVAALDHVERTARAGGSCQKLYHEVNAMLNTDERWKFGHHLGHGIGLAPHEAPRLNPQWNDTFQVGDVFTAEPGVYGEILNAGIRIEQNYLVTESGLERLSHFPVEL